MAHPLNLTWPLFFPFWNVEHLFLAFLPQSRICVFPTGYRTFVWLNLCLWFTISNGMPSCLWFPQVQLLRRIHCVYIRRGANVVKSRQTGVAVAILCRKLPVGKLHINFGTILLFLGVPVCKLGNMNLVMHHCQISVYPWFLLLLAKKQARPAAMLYWHSVIIRQSVTVLLQAPRIFWFFFGSPLQRLKLWRGRAIMMESWN